jgi:hypothetical protein
MKQAYGYVVLRYVHDILTGEFINVGLIMHVPTSKLLLSRTRSSIGRLKGVFPDLDRKAFLRAMSSVNRAISKAEEISRTGGMFDNLSDASSFAHLAVPVDDSSLQWSPISSGLTTDPEKSFDLLYERLIGRYDTRLAQRRTDDDVWRPVREKLAERKLNLHFEEKRVVGANDDISFKHARKNGVWHAYEPVSLDLADAEGIKDKARRLRGHLDAVFDGKPDASLKINFILGAPSDEKLLPAYQNALGILRKAPTNPSIYEENQIDDLVSEIEDEVRSHASG